MAQTKPKAGQFYGVSGNGTDGQFLRTDGAGGMSWAAPIVQPTLTSIDYPGTATAADPAGGESIIIYGTSFASGITCTVGGTSATTAFNSATQITITSPAKTAGQYTVEVTNTDGGTVAQANFIQYSGVPVWSTASGSLGSVMEGDSASFQVTATEGSDTIEYAITSGSLPSGLSLATATGAITGTAGSVSADTTSTFSITATDDENQTSSARSFSITVTNLAPSGQFNTILYTGTGSAQSFTTVGFQPDFTWIKERNDTDAHFLQDSLRGSTMTVYSQSNAAEFDETQAVTSFTSTGFNLGSYTGTNTNGNTYVAWNWAAGGAPTATNSAGAGNVPTSGSVMIDGSASSAALAGTLEAKKISVNTNSKFSIVQYTGGTGTLPHGLGVTPRMIMQKRTDASEDWYIYFPPGVIDTNYNYLILNNSDAVATTGSTAPTSTTFNPVSSSGQYIAYLFADATDFTKVGTFTGNGSINGPFIETGFEPAYVLIKCASNSGTSWRVMDNKRNPDNPRLSYLEPQSTAAEANYNQVNFYTNGFQLITTDTSINGSGRTQIYLALAADGSTSTPSLANSFQNFTWSGSGSAGTKTGLNFQPDAIFWKAYNTSSYNWKAVDSVRGKSQNATTYDNLYVNLTNSQNTDNSLSAINASSIDFNGGGNGNTSGLNYIGYSWKAGGLASINTDGTNIDSIVSANQAAGISVVKWAGDGSSSSTVGHGLGVIPDLIISKSTSDVNDWWVAHVGIPNSWLNLNSNIASFTGGGTNGGFGYQSTFTSSVFGFTAGSSSVDNVNKSGSTYIAYCFKSKANFSKFGTYTATGSAGTPTITTDFQPDVVFMKNVDRAQEWVVIDAARGLTQSINTNAASAQYTGNTISTNATSFTIDVSGGGINYASGDTFIYMAFKQN